MKLEIIVAMDQQGVIGHRQSLPWHLRADLLRFKALTSHHTIIMGRKTFSSIGRPLPNRHNLVLSRTMPSGPHHQCFTTLDDALSHAQSLHTKIFVIGGHDVFAASLPIATTLHLTRVHATVTGDVHFPTWDPARWHQVASTTHPADGENDHAMTFETYEKRPTVNTN